MRHLFLAVAMAIGALIATSVATTLLESRARLSATHSGTVWSAPQLADRWPPLKH
jgi:hypothetical protein